MESLETSRPGAVASLAAVRLERRSSSRIHTVMRVAKVTRAGDVGLWRVRNISNEGMMLLTAIPLVEGERLSLSLSDDITLTGHVVWWDGAHCGVAFDRTIDCAALLHHLVEEQRAPGHRPLRLAVDTRATVYCEKGLHSVRLYDLSQHGAAFTHDGCLAQGMSVKLVFENGSEHRGVIRWSDGERAGMFLTEPFPCTELESAARL